MPIRPRSYFVFAAIGLMSVAVLLWIGRGDRHAASGHREAHSNFEPADPATIRPNQTSAEGTQNGKDTLSPRARALLAELQRALASGPQREKEALLSFQDDSGLARFLARAGKNGVTVLDHSDRLRTVRVRFDSVRGLQQELTALADDLNSVTANNLFGVPQPPARQDRAELTHVPFGNDTLAYLGANADRSNWGRGLTLAIIDTGVSNDATFGGNRVRALDLGLGVSPGKGANDGHGTGVAALAAGLAPDAAGVAPAASVLSIRVTDANGLSDLFTLSQAIVAATDAGAKIINVSLGGQTTGAIMNAAIGYATQQGAVIVAAAGNDQAAQLAWPAADPRVVSVGAIDRAEQQVIFSNAGPQLQFTAPGYGVQTAWLEGQRAYVNGTSASAPLVAGAIAAVMSQNSNLTATQVVEILALTANDAGAPGADPAYGRGIINLATALNRNNSSYVDTAISSHYFDAANEKVQLVVQNRSGRSITGMSLNVQIGSAASNQTLPTLAPGETHVTTMPLGQTNADAKSVAITTQLVNPLGLVDQLPANNRKATVLTTPTP